MLETIILTQFSCDNDYCILNCRLSTITTFDLCFNAWQSDYTVLSIVQSKSDTDKLPVYQETLYSSLLLRLLTGRYLMTNHETWQTKIQSVFLLTYAIFLLEVLPLSLNETGGVEVKLFTTGNGWIIEYICKYIHN